MKRPLLTGTLLGALVLGSLGLFASGADTTVRPGDDLQAVLDVSRDGDVVRLAAGTYEGPIEVRRAVRIIGEDAAIHVPADVPTALAVSASGVTVGGLSISGAETGISIREVEQVSLRDVEVSGQSMHGIEVVDASASISGAVVEVDGEFAQGIEVRNSDGRPDSRIENTLVTGGQEGIVSHVSEVVVQGNVVRDTSMRAITITEMSDGVVRVNQVSGS